MAADKAVLLLAYGTPERLTDVEEYFTHIRGGRRPAPDAVEHLRARYARVGGSTPLRHITDAVRQGLERHLADSGMPHRVYIGMKHWHPYIAEAVRQMSDEGVREVTALALAPHYSRLSVGAYRQAVEDARTELGAAFSVRFVPNWYRQPQFVDLLAQSVCDALTRFPESARESVAVVFTAHSLPVRIRQWGDPYEAELAESSALVAREAGIGEWHFAWQSAGGTQEPWLGPDILEYLEQLRRKGVRSVLQVPIGFVSDHLEVLYDIDIEAKDKARSLGMTLERTELPNASPRFIQALAEVVRAAETPAKAANPGSTTAPSGAAR